jgi:hypothetical protein
MAWNIFLPTQKAPNGTTEANKAQKFKSSVVISTHQQPNILSNYNKKIRISFS